MANEINERHVAHTPRPWTLETVKTQIGICHKIGPFPGSCGREVGHACVYVDGQYALDARTGKEAELLSNAVLMTASPDLLHACMEALEWMEDHEEPPGFESVTIQRILRSAIGKAVGE